MEQNIDQLVALTVIFAALSFSMGTFAVMVMIENRKRSQRELEAKRRDDIDYAKKDLQMTMTFYNGHPEPEVFDQDDIQPRDLLIYDEVASYYDKKEKY